MPINRTNNKRTIKVNANTSSAATAATYQVEDTDLVDNVLNDSLATTAKAANVASGKPFISNVNNSETVLSVNLNDFNSRSDLINSNNYLNNLNNSTYSVSNVNSNNNNNNNNSELAMPDITFITEGPNSSKPKRIKPKTIKSTNKKIKFNRNLLWFPLIAFCLVALVALVAGITYSFVNNHFKSKQHESKNNSGITNYTHFLIRPTRPPFTSKSTNHSVSESTLSADDLLLISQIETSTHKSNECGNPAVKPNLRQVRIIRGHDAVPHSWPWTVSIGYYGPKSIVAHACGGSLINKRTVVTATHCVIKLVGLPVPNSSLYGTVEQMMRVFVGVNKRSSDIHTNNTYYAIKILSFPGFNENTFQNDLTLITLDRDVETSDDVSFICVSNQSNIMPGTQVYAVGWGFTEGNFFKASDTLMQVKIQVQSFENCGLSYIPIFQFCAGNPQLGKDTCNGDSGGPIMEYIDNRWILAGLVSNGDSGCTGRGVYTNIAFYYNWILENST